jgi:hypothetical protein
MFIASNVIIQNKQYYDIELNPDMDEDEDKDYDEEIK